MTDPFILSVIYQGEALDFTAQLLLQGYTHKFKVLIGPLEVYFEPDEEGSYRVITMPGQDPQALGKIDKHLLFEILRQLESVIK